MGRLAVAPIKNRSERKKAKLAFRKQPYFNQLQTGLHIGYAAPLEGAGTWVARKTSKSASGKDTYSVITIGIADDIAPTDWTSAQIASLLKVNHTGAAISKEFLKTILDYDQAVSIALAWAKVEASGRLLTFARACEVYFDHQLSHRGKKPENVKIVQDRMAKLAIPKFGNKLVDELRTEEIDRWLKDQVSKSSDPNKVRASRDTANRALAMLKAILNFAFKKGLCSSDTAWRRVERFPESNAKRELFLTTKQVQALIDAAKTQEFKNLLTAAYLTGCRYGELCALNVDGLRGLSLFVPEGKNGSRQMHLAPHVAEFFAELAKGRDGNEPLLVNPNGKRWQRREQIGRMHAAARDAGLTVANGLVEEPVLYHLRHAYISQALDAGASADLVAANTGTSEKMIRKHYAKFIRGGNAATIIGNTAPRLRLVA